jgi:Ca-activated chloride channel family protein
MFKGFTFIFSLCTINLLVAQDNERTHTRSGTKLFNNGNYTDAEASYRKALDKKNNFAPATFNLGNAIYKQPNRKEEAASQFELASKILTDYKQRAYAFHNMGNSYMDAQKYKEAASAYKQALKINPNDQDTKYNLAYANEKLRAQNQNDNKNKDQNKENQEKKDQENKDDKQEKNNDNDKQEGKDQKENKDKKDEGEAPKLSKEAAENILKALQNEEEKTQEKMNKKQGRPVEVKIEKDW